MNDQQISEQVKKDLVAKKKIIDNQLISNETSKKIIKNNIINELNVFKRVANRIQTKNL
jgi:hypothetical protein